MEVGEKVAGYEGGEGERMDGHAISRKLGETRTLTGGGHEGERQRELQCIGTI